MPEVTREIHGGHTAVAELALDGVVVAESLDQL
jgi:hypothetical protein